MAPNSSMLAMFLESSISREYARNHTRIPNNLRKVYCLIKGYCTFRAHNVHLILINPPPLPMPRGCGPSLRNLGTPVVPFCPFYFGVSLLKLNSRKKGTLIINGLLGNLVIEGIWVHELEL